MNNRFRNRPVSLLRRFATFLKYSAVSLSSSLIDMGMFQVFVLLLRSRTPARYIVLSTVFARIISSIYNFLMNYRVVFRTHRRQADRQPDTDTASSVRTGNFGQTDGLPDQSLNDSDTETDAVSIGPAAVRYFALVIVQMLCSAFLVNMFYRIAGLPELAVKIIVDSCLFVISYQIQKHLVFRNRAA